MATSTRLDSFVTAATSARDLLGHDAVRHRWSEPSALAEMSVGELAAHLGAQAEIVSRTVEAWPSDEEPVTLLEHYERSAWVGRPLDDEANVTIRKLAQEDAAGGPDALIDRANESLRILRSAESLPSAVRMPWW